MELLSDSLKTTAINIRNRTAWILNADKPSFIFKKTNKTEFGITELLTKIDRDKPDCFFISPHLDDAVLSAGALIHHLSGISNVSVATVFTETDLNPTPTRWTIKCGFNNSERLVRVRKQEDVEALKFLGVQNIYHLGYPDTECRKNGNDVILMQHVYNTILDLTNKTPNPMIFFPAADTRKNKDHQIIKEVSENFPPQNKVLWREFKILGKFSTDQSSEFKLWYGNQQIKSVAINKYASQLKALFPFPQIYLPPEGYLFQSKTSRKNQTEKVITPERMVEVSIG